MKKNTSGLILAALLAALAFGLNALPPLKLFSPLLFAILLGMMARNLGLIPASADAGLAFAAKKLLRAGVVLLGLRLSLPAVIELGWGPVLVIIVTVGCVYGTSLLAGRMLGLAHTSTVLTATGTAICGASAVAGMSAVVRERPQGDEQIDAAAATSIACVTIFGTLAMFLLPSLSNFWGLSDKQAGVWLGASIHEVGQVVAAGGFISPEVTAYATVTKLGRVVLLAPLIALVGTWESKYSKNDIKSGETPLIPLFVLGFLGLMLVRSLLGWCGLEGNFAGILEAANWATNALLTLAMAGLGAGVRIAHVLKTGARGVLLGGLASLAAAGVSLGLVLAVV